MITVIMIIMIIIMIIIIMIIIIMIIMIIMIIIIIIIIIITTTSIIIIITNARAQQAYLLPDFAGTRMPGLTALTTHRQWVELTAHWRKTFDHVGGARAWTTGTLAD
jgi:hypothetical protein